MNGFFLKGEFQDPKINSLLEVARAKFACIIKGTKSHSIYSKCSAMGWLERGQNTVFHEINKITDARRNIQV